jgi:arylsulfatase
MAIYAAQIDNMDQGIGRILAALEADGELDDTLIIFLSDNGGNHEGGELGSDDPVHLGEAWGWQAGQGILSYGRAWGNASNTPFRRYKSDAHEGGIATPMIAHWPSGITRGGQWDKSFVGHIIDFMPTFLELAQGDYPLSMNGRLKLPPEGTSLVSTFTQAGQRRGTPVFFEHEGNRAVITDEWKAVSLPAGTWELYNLDQDRTELNDLAPSDATRVGAMSALYEQWAERTFVTKKNTYPLTPRLEITVPGQGAVATPGSTLDIEWGVAWTPNVTAEVEVDAGAGFQAISSGSGFAQWVVPEGASGNVVIRVTASDGMLMSERSVAIQ